MKKLALLLVLVLWPVHVPGQTYNAIQGHSFIGGIPATTSGMKSSNYLNGIIPGASITVYLTGTTTKATIYANGSLAPLSNPFPSNLAGATNPGGWIFWAAGGQGYDVQAQGGMGNASCTTAPLCYSQATTLMVDALAGGSGGGGGSGTVNSGTTGQIAYYPANGTAVSGETTVPITAGGTGATTAAGAIANLGGVALTGATFTGPISAPVTNGCQTVGPATGSDGLIIQAAITAAGNGGCVTLTPGQTYSITPSPLSNTGLTIPFYNFIFNFNGACMVLNGTGDGIAITSGGSPNNVINEPCLIPGTASTGASIHDGLGAGLTINNAYWKQATGHSPAGGYYWHYLIQVDGDELLTVNQAQTSPPVLECDVTFCGSAFYNTPGLGTSGAAILYLNNSSLNLTNSGNGIDWEGYGNEVHLSSVVIESVSQYMIKATPHGGAGDILCSKCHFEMAGSTNPALNGIHAAALVIMNGGTFYADASKFEPSWATYTATGTTGSAAWTYWMVATSTLYGDSAPTPFAQVTNATTDYVGTSVVTTWPCIAPTAGDSVTFSILRTLNASSFVEAPYPNDGVADVVTTGQTCSGSYWNFTDTVSTSALTTYAFTPQTASSFFPYIGNWAGGVVLSASIPNSANENAASYIGSCKYGNPAFTVRNYSGVNSRQIKCVGPSYWNNTPGGVAEADTSDLTTHYNQDALVLQAKYGLLGPNNLKGILNLGAGTSAMDLLTVVDSNAYKTQANLYNRPAADAGDTAVGSDGSGNLALRSPTSISYYINSLFDGTSYLDRLTASTALFKQAAITFSGLSGLPSSGKYCLDISSAGTITPTTADCNSGSVVTTGSPTSGNIAAFSGSASITNATAAQLGTLTTTWFNSLTGCGTAHLPYVPFSGTCESFSSTWAGGTVPGASSFTAAGAASTPALALTGAPYAGGSTTTNYPLLYLNDGANNAVLSGSGTEFGINAPSGFGGLFADFHLNGGSSLFNVDSSGDVTVTGRFQSTYNNATAIYLTGADSGFQISGTGNMTHGILLNTSSTANATTCYTPPPIGLAGRGWHGGANTVYTVTDQITCATGTDGAITETKSLSGLTGPYNYVVNGIVAAGTSTPTTIGSSGVLLNGVPALQAQTSLFNYYSGGSGNLTGTGSNNTANGFQALHANITGGYNTAQGYEALYSNTTGNANSANGLKALYFNTSGAQNSAQGYEALYANTGGMNNTANGFEALYSNTGSDNTAQGYEALYSNTTGIQNSANGEAALYSNTTGSYNTANGYQAGLYISDGSTPNQTSSNSVYEGYQAYPLADGDTNENVIGNAAIGYGSNTTTLGNSSVTDTYLAGTVHGTSFTGNAATATALAAQAANTVVMNATGGSASPTAVAMPSTGTNGCAGTSNALTYNTSTHALGCNTISGSGTVTHTVGALTANAMVVGNGAADVQAGDFYNTPASSLLHAGVSSTGLTYAAGIDGTNTGSGGVATLRGANQTGAGSYSGAVAGGALVTGGSNASSSTVSQSGSVEITPGYSTAGGEEGVTIIGQAFKQGTGSHTQWTLQCLDGTNQQTANDCGASPTSFLGVTDAHTGSSVQVHTPPSITPIVASSAVTLGHTVCARTTAGDVTDSGGTSPCSTGITVGVVVATSGAWTFADGASTTITTTLPLVQMWRLSMVGPGDVNGTLTNNTTGTAAQAAIAASVQGVAGTLNTLTLANATSGLLTVETATGAITSYTLQLPVAQPAGANTYLSCTAANPAVCTWAAGSSGISGLTTGQLGIAGSSTTLTSSIAYTTAATASTIAERDSSDNINAITFNTAPVSWFGTGNANIGGSLPSASTGDNNSAVGVNSLASTTIGIENTAIGEDALYTNTSGSDNTAVGYEALVDSLSGNTNTAVGEVSLASLTTGSSNTAIGEDSGINTTTGSEGTFIGYGTGASSSGNTYETVIGASATGHGSASITLGRSADALYAPGAAPASGGPDCLQIATTGAITNTGTGCGGGGGTPSFPVTVAGTVTSGGVPYFSGATTESSSGILNSNILVKGGGAGGAPTNSSITDDGTSIIAAEPFTNSAIGNVPMTINGFSSGQTADLLDVYDYAGHIKEFSVSLNGAISAHNLIVNGQSAIGSTGVFSGIYFQATTLYSAAGTALPTCASGIKGVQAVVSDATSPTYMGAYSSGGTITAAVICSYNGTTYSWLTH